MHELLHAALPLSVGHGKLFKTAAVKLGLEGPMRQAGPGPLLATRLAERSPPVWVPSPMPALQSIAVSVIAGLSDPPEKARDTDAQGRMLG